MIIFNHLNITVYTHTTTEGHERIVGFEVEPMSIGEGNNRMLYDPDKSDGLQYLKPGEDLRFSYRIRTVNDERTTWAMRLDHYVKQDSNKVHWMSIGLSTMIIAFAGCVVYTNLQSQVSNDIRQVEMSALRR